MSENLLKVGNKGEIYTTKELRKALGISGGSWVKAEVHGDAVLLRKAKSLEELLEKRRIASISVEEFEEFSLRLQRAAARKKKAMT